MQGVGMENKRCILKFKKIFYYWQKKLRAKLIEATAPQLVQLEPVSVLADLLQINFRGAELKLPVGVDMDAVSGILDLIYDSMILQPHPQIGLNLYRHMLSVR